MKKPLSLMLVTMLFSSSILPTLTIAETTDSSATVQAEIASDTSESLSTATTEASSEMTNQVTQNSAEVPAPTATTSSTVAEIPTARISKEDSTPEIVTPDLVTGIYTEELADQYQTHPDVQAMLDSLTAEDIATSVGADGTGAKGHTETEEQEVAAIIARTTNVLGKYQDVNNYILQQKFPNPSISKDSRFDTLPKNDYKYNRPTGIVVHETANDHSSISSEVNYMYNNYNNAFVHAYVDNGKVIETAPTEYKAWGAGGQANPFYIHIELVRENSFHNFAKSVSNDAYWIASQLYQWGLTPSFADNNGGKGSVISHNAVSKYLGGTNHVDPVTYFAKWGYNMDQFYALIQNQYNAIKASDNRNATVKKRESFNYELVVASEAYNLYTNPYNTPGATALKKISAIAKKGDTIKVKEAIETSGGTKVYALENGLYVDQRALKPKATIVKEEPINEVMSISSLSYYTYNLPYNTLGASRQKKLSELYYKKQQVKVISALETSQQVKVYKLENGLYVDQRAIGKLTTIKKQTGFSPAKKLRVVNDTYNLYTQPYNTLGMSLIGKLNSKLKENATAEVTIKAETNHGVKTYYIKDLGWVDARALTDLATFNEEANFTPISMRVDHSGYNVYSAPYHTAGMAKLYQLKDKYPNGSTVKLTRYGKTSEGVKTYFVENLGWVDYRAFGEIKTYSDQADFKPKTMRIKSANYNIYKAPYQTSGWGLTTQIKNKYKVEDQVKVTRYGTTSGGVKTYYIENVGWVDYRALKDVATFKDDANFKAKSMRIKSNNYNLYTTAYHTEGWKLISQIKAKYQVNDQIEVTRYGTTSEGTKTYYIKNVGWVDYRSLKDVATYKDQTNFKAKTMTVKNANFNLYSQPYHTKDWKLIYQLKNKYKNGTKVEVTRYGTTSGGVKTYYIKNVGWVDYRALK